MTHKLTTLTMEFFLVRAREKLKEFLAWWRRGLLLLLPGRWLLWLCHQPDRITIEHRDDALLFRHYHGDTRQLREERTVQMDDETGKTAVNSWLNRHEYPPRPVLLLPDKIILQRLISYPSASEKDLRAMLEFEMDKQTPFAQDKVYFDYVITGKDTSNGQLHIILYLVVRDVLHRFLSDLRFLDAQPKSATIGSTDKPVDINLMPPSDVQANGKPDRRLAYLALAALILFITSLYAPLLRHGSIIEQFEQHIGQLRTQALQTQSLADKKQSVVERVNFLVYQTQHRSSPLQVILELTQRLPDNTWVDRLSIVGSKIEVHGESEAAAAIIQLIEESDYFEQTQFRSPVTKNNTTGKERFHIATQLRLAGGQ